MRSSASVAGSLGAHLLLVAVIVRPAPPKNAVGETTVLFDRAGAVIDIAFERRSPPDESHHDGRRPGLRHLTANVGHRSVAGPADYPDPHVSKLRGFDTLGVATVARSNVAAERGGLPALSAPWGRSTCLGNDAVTTNGDPWGARAINIGGLRGVNGDTLSGDG